MAKTKLIMTNRILMTQGSQSFNWSGRPAKSVLELREECSCIKKLTNPQFYALLRSRQYYLYALRDS